MKSHFEPAYHFNPEKGREAYESMKSYGKTAHQEKAIKGKAKEKSLAKVKGSTWASEKNPAKAKKMYEEERETYKPFHK